MVADGVRPRSGKVRGALSPSPVLGSHDESTAIGAGALLRLGLRVVAQKLLDPPHQALEHVHLD